MKILFTGGGTGGHFYPIVAVIEALEEVIKKEKVIEPKLYYLGTEEFDARALYDHNVQFEKIYAGKRRNYFSILNFFDFFKTGYGILGALSKIYSIYPDVVFSKGGYVSFPVLFAARFFKIPVIIHESDTVPGRVNLWASKFAKRIAISWPDAAQYFPKDKVAWTGNPVRKGIIAPLKFGAHEYLKLNANTPTILILGGSQGSKRINETILSILPELLEKYQIIHQTGVVNFTEVTGIANTILKDNPNTSRYKPFNYLNDLGTEMAAGASNLVISRAGSSIFEIACWGIPSIIIPIPEAISRDQTQNALAYTRTGSCIMIEEKNLAPHILKGEIDRLLSNPTDLQNMALNAHRFAKKDAAEKIAKAILDIALEHEK
ncbi:MAG: undecaprenyldiphospho-muramoylpentapeptide beta-N-acetylglucosaminyltransferase [bacterium]